MWLTLCVPVAEVTDAVGIDINGGKVPQVGSVPPAPNASMHDKLDFLHCQLDSLRNRQVLSGLLLQDGGSNRLVGGTHTHAHITALQCFVVIADWFVHIILICMRVRSVLHDGICVVNAAFDLTE